MFLGETKTRLRPKISSPVRENREEGEDEEDEEDTQSMIFARRQSGGGEERCTPGGYSHYLLKGYLRATEGCN